MKLFKAKDFHNQVLVPTSINHFYCSDIMRWRSTETDPGIYVTVKGKEIELRYETEFDRDSEFNELVKLMECELK